MLPEVKAPADFKRAVAVFDRLDVKAPELEHEVVVAHQYGNRDRQSHDRGDERRPDAGSQDRGVRLCHVTHAAENVHHPPDGAEKSQKRGDDSDEF